MTDASQLKTTLPALLICFALALTGCRGAESHAEPDPSSALENEELARRYVEAYNARDRTTLEAILAEHITMNGAEYSRDDFLAGVQGYWQVFPDIELQPTHIVGADDHVTIRWDFSATAAGEYNGYDVDGREVRSSELILFHVRDGQLAEYWYNWDALGFWVQLGAIEQP